MKMHQPPECFANLKCSLCNRLLSVFPIYIKKNDQQLSVCGRCQLPDNENYLRNEMYENLAKNLLFPCINREQGCMENLLPDDVKQHELICFYRYHLCIFNNQKNCKWNGCFNQLLEHCKVVHEDIFLKNNQFEFDMFEDHNVANIFQYCDEMFLFKHNFNQTPKQFKCSIIPLGFDERTKKYYGEIELTTKDTTITKKFPEIDFNENHSKSIDINMESVLNENSIVMKGTIKIIDNKEQLNYNTKINKEPLHSQKCVVCNEIVEEYVYNCTDDYYTFLKCKNNCFDSNTICPYGCNFVTSEVNLESHYCLYKPLNCLINYTNCRWQGRCKDFTQHIIQNHTSSLIQLNQIITMPVNPSISAVFSKFMTFSGHSFQLQVLYTSSRERRTALKFQLAIIDRIVEENSFKFEIFMYDKDNVQQIIMRRSIDKLSANGSVSLNMDLYPYTNLIFDNTVKFKLNIFK